LFLVDVESMDQRTNPLGAPDDSYPVDDYIVPMPDTEDVTDLIRMEKLRFMPVKERPEGTRHAVGPPMVFDAAISFACGGESWPMKLRYNVDFINAFPCHQGPHVLFYDFSFKAIKIDEGLVDIQDWGNQSGRIPRPTSSKSSPGKKALALMNEKQKSAHEQVTNVLVI